jgi:uncharacterized protein with ATP-grasp and redox domains
MKVAGYCRSCLKGLVERTLALAGADENLLAECLALIEQFWETGATPPGIANRLLKLVRERTGVYDPYRLPKERELEQALGAVSHLEGLLPRTLEGVLKLSALGNSMDHFATGEYHLGGFEFRGELDKIEEAIYIKRKDVLIIGDNPGDFIFDLPLIHYLQGRGKRVHYAVKEHPVQNDLSIFDVERLGLRSMFANIISTGTDEVGIKKEDLRGEVRRLWEQDVPVIAKGMGNFETLSETDTERPVIHIMKVKCPAVSEAIGEKQGTYIASIRG